MESEMNLVFSAFALTGQERRDHVSHIGPDLEVVLSHRDCVYRSAQIPTDSGGRTI